MDGLFHSRLCARKLELGCCVVIRAPLPEQNNPGRRKLPPVPLDRSKSSKQETPCLLLRETPDECQHPIGKQRKSTGSVDDLHRIVEQKRCEIPDGIDDDGFVFRTNR
mmetsp:Transcript_11607/g.26142  ORF Transcript_11607/g.26142 Transcript_11607/m.26142 type:complete len:108 (-) Transcript_11607:355-678(-)